MGRIEAAGDDTTRVVGPPGEPGAQHPKTNDAGDRPIPVLNRPVSRVEVDFRFWHADPTACAVPPGRSGRSGFLQKCLDAKGVGCEEWEKEIDERVEGLYGLREIGTAQGRSAASRGSWQSHSV